MSSDQAAIWTLYQTKRFCSMVNVAIAIMLLSMVVFTATMEAHAAAGDAAEPTRDVPVNIEGTPWDPEMWRYLRHGGTGRTVVPDQKARQLIQSSGEQWRIFRVERLPGYGAWVLAGMCATLIVFFMIRGRIRIETGFAQDTILRFGSLDRFALRASPERTKAPPAPGTGAGRVSCRGGV